jgi:predicted dehydrogenase
VSAPPLRAGIIGLGWIARVHVPALDAAGDIELVAACDTDLERAEAIARPRGARAYASWEEMLDREELDALWVCTPPLSHRDPTLAALARGIHVYLEKPIAPHAGRRRGNRLGGAESGCRLRGGLPVARQRARRGGP